VAPDPLGHPTNRATFIGGALTYNPPLRYQWQFEGGDIPGETNSTLSFTNVQLSDEGLYTLIASDSVGPVQSQAANLFALVTPAITLAPVTQTVPTGAVVSLSVAGTGNPLPFGWEWRRGSFSLGSNVVNSRTDFFTFTNGTLLGTQVYRVVLRSLSGQANVTFNITTVADSDGDGIPDVWEQDYFGTPNGAGATDDSDGDGMGNRSEYMAGTNPTNSASFLKVELNNAPGTPEISFGAEPGKTYSIEFSDDLATGSWAKLSDVLARTNSRVEVISDPGGNTNRFYRVVTPRSVGEGV
jgi:hypothetical protein